MSTRIRAHVRSNVIGYIALFFSLSLGTAWALDANSVKSRHIVNGQVKAKDIKKSEVQVRVDETCAPGLSIRAIADNGAVTCEATVGDGSITTAKLGDLAVTPGKVALDSLTAQQLGINSVDQSELQFGSVTSVKIDDGTVDNVDLATDSVRTGKVQNGSLDAADIGKAAGSYTLDFPNVASGSCVFDDIPDTEVTTENETILVTPNSEFPAALKVYATPVGAALPNGIHLVVCNDSSVDFNPNATQFNYVIFDN